MSKFDMRLYYGASKEKLEELRPYWEFYLLRWKDHIAEFGDVLKETIISKDKDGNDYVRHERFDGVIFQEGTPIAAENLGKMDMDIYMLYLWVEHLQSIINDLILQISTLLGQNLNNMPYNTTFLSARNINVEVKIIEGWYDEANGRGVV